MIELVNVSKKYKKVVALHNINFKIVQGDFISIIGKSGAGKSTLLNILAGIDVPSNGKYLYNGEVLPNDIHSLSKFRVDNIGIIVQNFALINSIKVYDNIALPLKYQKYSKERIKNEVIEISKVIGIEDKLNSYPNKLSGGECQRVAIARAVVKKSKIILADEPTGSLDDENRDIILSILKDLNKNGVSIIIVTHDLEIAKQTHKKYTMENGMFV